MGGYVNLSVRKNNEVTNVLAYTGVISKFFNPGLFKGENEALNDIFHMYNDCLDVHHPDARSLAPFSYGLIVIDLDANAVLDMQSAAEMNMFSATSVSYAWNHIGELAKLGWLGDGLYNLLDGSLLVRFPEDEPISPDLLKRMVGQELDKIVLQIRQESESGRFPLPAYKIHPPGWTYRTFESHDAANFKLELQKRGFLISKSETTIWDAWIDENRIPPQDDQA